MTVQIFIWLFTLGAAVAALLTQALKKGWKNIPSNLTALIVSIVVGAGGTAAAYILMDIAWNPKNIVCLILMVILVWIGAMVGYDKVIQLLDQLKLKK